MGRDGVRYTRPSSLYMAHYAHVLVLKLRKPLSQVIVSYSVFVLDRISVLLSAPDNQPLNALTHSCLKAISCV